MKALIDRAGFVGIVNGGMLSRKVGAAVVAQRRGGSTHVMDTINHLFLMSRMIVPGSTYWNFANGREEGEAGQDQEGLANMADLGQTIAWLLKNLPS
jgi:multimeric flavodoxin WrbA